MPTASPFTGGRAACVSLSTTLFPVISRSRKLLRSTCLSSPTHKSIYYTAAQGCGEDLAATESGSVAAPTERVSHKKQPD